MSALTADCFHSEHVPRARAETPDRNLNDDLKYFKLLLGVAYRKGLVPLPVPKIAKPSIEGDVGRELSDPEIKRLFADCDSDCLRFQMEMALRTGMRKTELLSCEWRFIDWDRGTIRLPARVTKTKRGREFPLSQAFSQALLERQKGVQSRFLFPSRTRDDWHQLDVKTAWTALRVRAGVDCRWHDFRHTCATRMVRSGTSLAFVARYLGMSQRVLIRIYNHVSIDDLRGAANAVDLSFLRGD